VTDGQDTGALLCLTTLPDADAAARVARTLVEERLAACVTMLGPARSIYRWQGAVEDAQEVVCLIKTRADGFARLAERLRAIHPYEVPELLAFEPSAGLPAYLGWVAAEVLPAG
jgi:periplasmic divalent cation tolerance protein